MEVELGFYFFTCPATAKPSDNKEDVIQTCKQVWNAAMGVGPSLAANDAARVTQKVTATTLASNKPPAPIHSKFNKR